MVPQEKHNGNLLVQHMAAETLSLKHENRAPEGDQTRENLFQVELNILVVYSMTISSTYRLK